MKSIFKANSLQSIIFLSILCVSCATSDIVQINYPIRKVKYISDTVSVKTAIDLALQSYIRACVGKEKKHNKVFFLCLKKGKKFVNDEIIFILNQDARPKENKNPSLKK